MVEEENGIILSDEGELLIHEDSIFQTTENTVQITVQKAKAPD